MSDFNPYNVGYYGKPLSSLTRDELINAVLELAAIIHNCPVKGRYNELLERIDKEKG